MPEPLSTDHWFAPALTIVKHSFLAPFQVRQKPSLDNFQVPSPPFFPPPTGWRFIFPSAVNVILNLTFEGVDAVNGFPPKNVVLISSGESFAAGAATPDVAR